MTDRTPIAIVTDADCCVPAALIAAGRLVLAPTGAPLLEEDESPRILRAEQAPADALAVVDACLAAASAAGGVGDILYVGCGDGYGAAPDAAVQAAAALAATYPQIAFHAVATEAALMGAGWGAVAAAEAVQAGADVAAAMTIARRVAAMTQTLFLLEYPQLAGLPQGLSGVTFHARALARLNGSVIETVDRPIRRDYGLVQLRDTLAAAVSGHTDTLRLAIHHAGSAAAADALTRWANRTLPGAEIVTAPLTRHAATRLGPRLVGFAWYHRDTSGRVPTAAYALAARAV